MEIDVWEKVFEEMYGHNDANMVEFHCSRRGTGIAFSIIFREQIKDDYNRRILNVANV